MAHSAQSWPTTQVTRNTSPRSFPIDNTATVLIDQHIKTFGCVHSIDTDLIKIKKNVKILVTFTAKMNMPLALTSSMYVRAPFFW